MRTTTTLLTVTLSLLLAAGTASAATNWALAINGDSTSCTASAHGRNVALAVETLVTLGFEEDHIVVLSHAHDDIAGSDGWIDPNRSELRSAIDTLAKRIRPEDTLVVYMTGHGYRRGNSSYLVLGDRLVSADWLAEQLADVNYGRLVVISDQCFSGGFESSFATLPRSVFVASASAEQRTSCVSFIRPFWRAMVNPKADRDGDGQVSIEEAYNVASASAAQRAVASRPSEPIYIGFGGRSLENVTEPTRIAMIPTTGTAIAMLPAAGDQIAAALPVGTTDTAR